MRYSCCLVRQSNSDSFPPYMCNWSYLWNKNNSWKRWLLCNVSKHPAGKHSSRGHVGSVEKYLSSGSWYVLISLMSILMANFSPLELCCLFPKQQGKHKEWKLGVWQLGDGELVQGDDESWRRMGGNERVGKIWQIQIKTRHCQRMRWSSLGLTGRATTLIPRYSEPLHFA